MKKLLKIAKRFESQISRVAGGPRLMWTKEDMDEQRRIAIKDMLDKGRTVEEIEAAGIEVPADLIPPTTVEEETESIPETLPEPTEVAPPTVKEPGREWQEKLQVENDYTLTNADVKKIEDLLRFRIMSLERNKDKELKERREKLLTTPGYESSPDYESATSITSGFDREINRIREILSKLQ